MTTLSIDFETRSTVPLPDTGVYPYAVHPTTDIILMAWAFDDEEPVLWFPSVEEWHGVPVGGLPDRVRNHIVGGGAMRAHNAAFERAMWRGVMVPKYGAPPIADDQWYCSAAEAAAMALPRSLGQLTKVLGVDTQKDDAGHRLMMQMCKPRKIMDDGTIIWWDEPAKIKRLGEYCITDVKAEQAASKCLRPLDPAERAVFLLDQTVNDRGMRIDRELVLAAQELAAEGINRANLHIADLTSGGVLSVSNHGKLKAWLNENGVETESTDKAHVAEMLEDPNLPETVRRVLQLRADGARSSVAKLQMMLDYASNVDDRMRGMLLYHGASTGRWSGRGPQPHNFPRGTVKNIEALIPFVLDRDYDTLNLVEHPLTAISSMLRSMMCSAPGADLMAGDYSAIEARVLNWLAGQTDKIELFAAGKDVYKDNAAHMYKVRYEDVTAVQRHTGKFQELACGFGMGADKAVTAAKTIYQLTLTPAEAKAIVANYRLTHTDVVNFWKETNQACMQAIRIPGVAVVFGGQRNLKVFVAGKYLYLVLPSKRVLMYAAPKIVNALAPWGDYIDQVEISAVDAFSRGWGRARLYGGLIVENIVQATARDIMAEGMLRLEQAGYPVIMSVHDEVITELPEGHGTLEEFNTLLTTAPAWAVGCPIAAESWRGKRYKK